MDELRKLSVSDFALEDPCPPPPLDPFMKREMGLLGKKEKKQERLKETKRNETNNNNNNKVEDWD